MTPPPDAAGLVIPTSLFGDLALPPGAGNPSQADELWRLAGEAAAVATQARSPGTLRADRSA